MRKYLKPAMDMEAFDVEDIITASGEITDVDQPSDPGTVQPDNPFGGGAAAPIFVDFN